MWYRVFMRTLHGLDIRVIRDGIVRVRASNDTLADEYGTVITVEALMRDWLPAFWQHRTISLQHNITELRGIGGKPFVGRALRADFTPQLEVEIEILDDETRELVNAGKITGASLEFLPVHSRTQHIAGHDSLVYYALASEPELAGLTLTDMPAVPGANILDIRTAPPAPWAFAVVDPAIFKLTSIDEMQQLMWFPHHDLQTHMVDPALLDRALSDLVAGNYNVPAHSSLTREEVANRALEHLRRHTTIGIGMRSNESAEVIMDNTLDTSNTQTTQPQAQPTQPQELPVDTRAQAATAQLTTQATTAQVSAPAPAPVVQAVTAQPVVQADDISPEPSTAVVTDGSLSIRSRRASSDEVLVELMMRSVVPQLQRRQPTATERQEIDNILRRNGIDVRAITIEANGTVIYNDLARQFVSRPDPSIIARNHWVSVPMGGTIKRTFPRFDRGGITHTWGRNSTANIADSDPSLDTFEVEVTELNSKTVVPDSFSQFNAQGPTFIQSVLIPKMRDAAQYEEDRAFFLSSGVAPDPTKIIGLRNKTGVTVVAPSTNGDAFNLSVLSSLLRAMPVRYRGDVTRLAYYIAVARADDYGDILSERQTPGGDTWLQRFANQPGPAPIGVHRSIPIYAVPHLPTNETQGTSTDCTTIYLVHRDIPVIGDALSIRIEPYRRENFMDVLQLQEFVGLGYQWPDAIVRRSGVRPRT